MEFSDHYITTGEQQDFEINEKIMEHFDHWIKMQTTCSKPVDNKF